MRAWIEAGATTMRRMRASRWTAVRCHDLRPPLFAGRASRLSSGERLLAVQPRCGSARRSGLGRVLARPLLTGRTVGPSVERLLMRVQIRAMSLHDYADVRALWERSPGIGLGESDSRDAVILFLERNPQLSTVAVAGDRIVGAVFCGYDGQRGLAASPRGGCGGAWPGCCAGAPRSMPAPCPSMSPSPSSGACGLPLYLHGEPAA